MIKNTDQNYGSIAKLFHWVMGITIICLLIIGFLLENLNYSLVNLKFRLSVSIQIELQFEIDFSIFNA